MKLMLRLFIGVCLAALGEHAFAAFIGSSNYVAQTFYANPHAGETLVAFDWDEDSNLYYSTGRPDYGLGISVYRYNGVNASLLYTDANAFSGSRVTAIGGRIYFNDGGTYTRYTCDYYRYDPTHPSAPANIGILSDIYGLETRDGTDFWAAGGYNSAIYYSALNANGDLVSNPLVNLGAIGAASGPIAFDASSNLFYAEGYVSSGNPTVYRWSAAEVSAAIANPAGAPLSPVGHAWATLSAGDGASGMVVDNKGRLVITATSFTDASELQRLFVTNGNYAGYAVLARSDERMETVRIRDGKIYVSSSEGIFTVVPSQAEKQPINDYDGDGKSDLAVFRNGYWNIFLMGSHSVLEGGFGAPNSIPVSGDYDGDGKSDLAVFHNGDWSIFLMGSHSVLEGGFGAPNGIPVSGDYDGDGKSDLAVFHNGDWSIFLMGSHSILEGGFGAPNGIPVSGDYDGDGKSDLAVFHNGDWSIFLMGSHSALEGGFGAPDGIPVSGDYDGDSKSDLAVFRNGYWNIFLVGSGSVLEGGFGAPGGIPLSGDYDGDGKSDLAVFHNGDWSIFLMGSHSVLEGGFGASDGIPVK
ncbi:MAG: VCBS repeat-containing protein [Kiritimatiellia bacterium]